MPPRGVYCVRFVFILASTVLNLYRFSTLSHGALFPHGAFRRTIPREGLFALRSATGLAETGFSRKAAGALPRCRVNSSAPKAIPSFRLTSVSIIRDVARSGISEARRRWRTRLSSRHHDIHDDDVRSGALRPANRIVAIEADSTGYSANGSG